MIQHRDTDDESEAAMTDERERKERVFDAWAVYVYVGGEWKPSIHLDKSAAVAFAAMVSGRLVRCRVIVEE